LVLILYSNLPRSGVFTAVPRGKVVLYQLSYFRKICDLEWHFLRFESANIRRKN
jgi:hypothetical protein